MAQSPDIGVPLDDYNPKSDRDPPTPSPAYDDLKYYPACFVQDYASSMWTLERRRRLVVSSIGHILHIGLFLTLYFICSESSRVADITNMGSYLVRAKSDEWIRMKSPSDWWIWFQTKMAPQFYRQDWYAMRDENYVVDPAYGTNGIRYFDNDDKLAKVEMYRYNMIVGAMRVQQKRVIPNQKCSIPEKSYRPGEVCYGYLVPDNEDKESFTGLTSSKAYVFDGSGGTTWWGSIPGQWAAYHEGGYNFDFVPNQTTAEWTDQLNTLKRDLWLDYPTRMVSVTMTTYNAGLDMFANFQFLFEFSATGSIYRKITTQVFTSGFISSNKMDEVLESVNQRLLKLIGSRLSDDCVVVNMADWLLRLIYSLFSIVSSEYNDAVRVVCMGMVIWITMHFLMNLVIFTISDVQECLTFDSWWNKRQASKKGLERPEVTACSIFCSVVRAVVKCTTFWRVIDWAIVILEGAWIMLRIAIFYKKDDFQDIDLNTSEYIDSLSLSSLVVSSNKVLGANLFFLFFKSLKFLDISRHLAVMYQTLCISIQMLGPFFCAFIFVFFGFAFWGHITFGSEDSSFATPILSINTAVDMLIGNGDLPALYAANRLMGPLFYFMYTIAMTLILINVFIAIMCEAYEQAKSDASNPPPFGDEARPGASGILRYLRKIQMVLTFNMCFTCPDGLPMAIGREWKDVGIGERFQLVAISMLCYMFNGLILFRLTDSGDDRYLRTFQIYEHRYSLELTLEHLREEAIELNYIADTEDDFYISQEAVAKMFGDLDDVEVQFSKWGGPEDERAQEGSTEFGISQGVRSLALELREFEDQVLGPSYEHSTALKSLLETWKDRKANYKVVIDDFPLEMLSLDVHYQEYKSAREEKEKTQEQKKDEDEEKKDEEVQQAADTGDRQEGTPRAVSPHQYPPIRLPRDGLHQYPGRAI